MRKSDIYEIAIKILGLYLVVIVIGQLRDLLTYSTILFQPKNDFITFPFFIATVFSFLVLTAFSGLLIFRTKFLAKLICKKADYEETTRLFTDKRTIYEISLTLVGLLTIILTLPDFAFKLNNHIQLIHINLPTNDFDTILITSGLKIAIGLVAIIYSKSISSYFTKEGNLTEKSE